MMKRGGGKEREKMKCIFFRFQASLYTSDPDGVVDGTRIPGWGWKESLGKRREEEECEATCAQLLN